MPKTIFFVSGLMFLIVVGLSPAFGITLSDSFEAQKSASSGPRGQHVENASGKFVSLLFPDARNNQFSFQLLDWLSVPPSETLPPATVLKSAPVMIEMNPQEFELGTELIGNLELTERSAPAAITVKLVIPPNSTQEDILKMFAETAQQLPMFVHEPAPFSAFQAKNHQSSAGLALSWLVGFLFVSAAFGMLAYLHWRKLMAASSELNQQQSAGELTRLHDETRMALVGKMTSTVIHDVKNAFTAIQSCAEVMAEDELDPMERKDFAQLIVSEIERGVGMTQELLEFVRGEARSLNIRPYSANFLVQETLAVLKQEFIRQHITLQTELRYAGTILVDPDKMRRAFMNIVSNACGAMPDGGTLTIRLQELPESIELAFIDTGCGMSPDLQARIFEPLVSEGKVHGTGLGMTIVKEILDAHQARIEIESEVGRGTAMRLYLPR